MKRAPKKPRNQSARVPRAPGVPPKTPGPARAEKPKAIPRERLFPIVGVGASAGGLEAFTQLLEHLPVSTGMAFVLVQHLDPTHQSILAQILAKTTEMPVHEVRNRMPVEPNCVYIIPPNARMSIAQGVLKLDPRERTRASHHCIDFFFESLAKDRGHLAVGVVLSGSNFDGTLGLEAIRNEGGITFAQDEKSAKYDTMPRNAVWAGCVDFALPPNKIAVELGHLSESFLRGEEPPRGAEPGTNGKDFKKVLQLLHRHSGVDFNVYKPTTIRRRLKRRILLKKLSEPEAYAAHLAKHPAELEALYQDLLISVTEFFRNPEAFEALRSKIFPQLARNRSPNNPVRVWVLGCSTGQEAYSIAMLFREFAADTGTQIPLQVFATDLNETLLENARAGLYSKSQVLDLSRERLRRFFIEEEGGYRICKPIRELCVFARHNLLTDPPFSRMDLVSCRNLLIYLEPSVHKKLIPVFHYSLKPAGFLLLGTSETIGAFTDLFHVESKAHKIYSKKASAARPILHLPAAPPPTKTPSAGYLPPPRSPYPPPAERDTQKEADGIVLAKYAPAGAVVNADFEVLQFRGYTSPYLEPMPGKASFNILKMAREGLLMPLRAALTKAKKEDQPVRTEGLEIRADNQNRRLNLEVIPLKNHTERSYLVLFEPGAGAPSGSPPAAKAPPLATSKQTNAEREIRRLQSELGAAKDYLQTISEQYEAANEELQSANEEAQSSNEELQSINEELETTKEELESANEELTTVNEEMNHRNLELNRVNNDLSNVLTGVQICIVVMDRDLRIRRFTPPAEKVLNLVPTDVGRPITHLKPNIDFPQLGEFILETIDQVSARDTEVQDQDGRWYSLRVLPYKTTENKIDGAVLVLVDVHALKQSEQRVQAALNFAQCTLETIHEPLLVLDGELHVESANPAFYQMFNATPEDILGRFLYELGRGQWNIPALRQVLQEMLPRQTSLTGFEVDHEFEGLGRRIMVLNARQIVSATHPPRILLAIEDVTERKQIYQQLAERTARLQESVGELEAFSYSISHDMRAPLRAMLGFADAVLADCGEQISAAGRDHLQRIIAAAHRLDRLIVDILTYSRVGRSEVHLHQVNLDKLVGDIIRENPSFQPPHARIKIDNPLPSVIGHEASLSQVVANLLSNAVKFVSPGTVPRIHIQAEPRNGQVRIWFKDNGIGIDPADHERIFRLFEKIHPATDYAGTGIGLSIARKAVERIGGTIGVESEPGQGTKFWIQLEGAIAANQPPK